MKKKILLAGGSGFVGDNLRRFLVGAHHEVYILTTQRNKIHSPYEIYWNPSEKKIELNDNVRFDVIVNLAGANIGEKYWTQKRKKVIWSSRIDSTRFLVDLLHAKAIFTEYFIQFSAIGFYGDRNKTLIDETSVKGTGFLSDLCESWENEVRGLDVTHSILRLGVVFSPEGGAFQKLVMTLNFKISLVFGFGNNYISWIECIDVVRMIHFMIEHRLTGVYNAVSPYPIKNLSLLRLYAKHKGIISMPLFVPKWLIKLILGDFSELLVDSQRISSKKIEQEGFKFKVSKFTHFLKLIK